MWYATPPREVESVHDTPVCSLARILFPNQNQIVKTSGYVHPNPDIIIARFIEHLHGGLSGTWKSDTPGQRTAMLREQLLDCEGQMSMLVKLD